jgi:hypothetical protein
MLPLFTRCKRVREAEVWLHTFLTSALIEVSGQIHVHFRSTPGKKPPVPIEEETEWPVLVNSVRKIWRR